MSKVIKWLFFNLILVSLTGCLTNPIVPEDSCDNSIPIELSEVDYLLFANQMVDEMTASKAITQLTESNRIHVYLQNLENDSSEVIDLNQIELAIRNRLQRSAKITLVDEPVNASYRLSGKFSEALGDCQQQVNRFSMLLTSASSEQILWSQSKSYRH